MDEAEQNYLNYLLKKFYREKVTLKQEEISQTVKGVARLVDGILKEVHRLDNRFKTKPLRTGSYYQGLKVERPNEFDYCVNLDVGSTEYLRWYSSGLYKRYYGFDKPDIPDPAQTARRDMSVVSAPPLPPPPIDCLFFTDYSSNNADLKYEWDIVPFLVKRHLRKLINKSVKKLINGSREDPDSVRVQKLMHGPATTLVVESDEDDFPLTIDFSAIISTTMSFPPWMEWPRQDKLWPSWEKIQTVKSKGINLLAKYNFYWSIDTAECEKELLTNIDTDGGCRKQSQRILKRLKDEWRDKRMKAVLSSYCLKNALYWECEEYPYTFQWAPDKLGERILSMTRQLRKCLIKGRVPWYFCPEVDVLRLERDDDEERARLINNMHKFLEDPCKLLAGLLGVQPSLREESSVRLNTCWWIGDIRQQSFSN